MRSPFRLQKPSSCTGCPLQTLGTGFSEPEGTGANGVMLIGEACGEHEAKDGYPFRPYAEGGSLLNRAIGMSGSKRESFSLFNILACRPPMNELVGAGYEQGAIAHCRVHLLNAVDKYRPKVLVAVGAVAARSLTGLAGDRLSLDYIRGFALDSTIYPFGGAGCIPVVPTYHPIFIKRGQWAMLPVLAKDINTAVGVAQEIHQWGHALLNDISGLRYVTDASQNDLEALRDDLKNNPDMPLSTDAETNYAELKEEIFKEDPELSEQPIEKIEMLRRLEARKQDVTQINFSVQEGTAVVCTATPPNLALVKEIHALPNVKVGHNLLMYDKPVYEDNGIPMAGELEDTMWRFHHIYPDLPGRKGRLVTSDNAENGSVANLQFCASFYGFPVPWKHESTSNPGWYGGCDADSALRVFWGTDTDMRGLDILDSYYERVQSLFPALENMRLRGMPTNAPMIIGLHDSLVTDIRAIDGNIQIHAPREILPLHPKAGWKKAPKNAETGGIVQVRKAKGESSILIPATLIEIDVDLMAEIKVCCMRARKPGKKTGEVDRKYAEHPKAHMRGDVMFSPNPDCQKCGGTGVLSLPDRTERRWAGELPFNAASPEQMWAYVHYRGYTVPKNSKKKHAMDAETIEKLTKRYQDPIFELCVRKRRYVKLDSTYCGGWMPGADGRVHPQIGPYPASVQLAGRKPNPQNVPNLSKIVDPQQLVYSTQFRNALYAEPGHCIIEGDFAGFHVGTLGFEAQDPMYIRLSKIDIHSFFATVGLLGVEKADALLALCDQELKAKLKWYRKNYQLKNGQPFEMLRNKQAKVAVLAYGLGQGSHSLYLQNPDSFDGPGQAEKVVQSMNATFPKEKLYRDTQPLTVKPGGYKIRNRFGFIRWFFDVQRYDFRHGEWKHGDDWEAAIAYNVQASAHGHLRECVMICERLGYNERYGFDNTVHDSLRYHCLIALWEECVVNVGAVMQHESEVMKMPWDNNRGMSFNAEFKKGLNWGSDMREVTI